MSRILIGAVSGLLISTAAFAQSLTAPAGIATTVAPGGLEGRSAATSTYDQRATAAVRDEGSVTGSVRHVREHGASRR